MTDFPADRTLRIGTRSSPMALAQTEQVKAILLKHEPELKTEVVPVTTEADKWQGDLAQLGGKRGISILSWSIGCRGERFRCMIAALWGVSRGPTAPVVGAR